MGPFVMWVILNRKAISLVKVLSKIFDFRRSPIKFILFG